MWVVIDPCLIFFTQDLVLPRTWLGTECRKSTPDTWPYFEEMHKAMVDKDLFPITTVADYDVVRELDEAVGISSVNQPRSPSPGPSTSADPLPGCPRCRTKRKNEILEYLKEYGERQEKRQRELDAREERREKKKEQQIDKLIEILAKLVEKNK